MIQRLYINNFRCLENFECVTKDISSLLLIGKNGAGKSTIRFALEILQSIGRGVNRIGHLVKRTDFGWDRVEAPIRIELEVCLRGDIYRYILAVELPESFKEARVLQEELHIAGIPIYTREYAQVCFKRQTQAVEARFSVDWHLVALPVIQVLSDTDPLHIFKTWLARMLILAPVPSLIKGVSQGESLELKSDASNFCEWFSGVLARYPAAYTQIDKYLNGVISDIEYIENEVISSEFKIMSVHFKNNQQEFKLFFDNLSDGEKCFFVCALVVAANKFYGPLFCFWDEPDNFLSLHEVGHFVATLRRAFRQSGSQLFISSHNPEAIRKFSDETTLILSRKNRLEPTRSKWLQEFVDSGDAQGDIINVLTLGDIL